jgi:hypothetical protein
MDDHKKVMRGFLENLAKDASFAQESGAQLGDFLHMHEATLIRIFRMVEQEGLDKTLKHVNTLLERLDEADLSREFGAQSQWLN